MILFIEMLEYSVLIFVLYIGLMLSKSSISHLACFPNIFQIAVFTGGTVEAICLLAVVFCTYPIVNVSCRHYYI